MKSRCVLAFLLAVAPLASLAAQPAAKQTNAGARPGGAPASFQVRTFKAKDGQVLSYSLFVPPSAKAGEKFPLVLCLHGAGGNTAAAASARDASSAGEASLHHHGARL